MNHALMFDMLVVAIKADISGFDIGFKDESWLSKLLGVLSYPFNPNYMTQFTTTRYPKVYFPSREYLESDYKRGWKILAHEWVHLHDRRTVGVWFNLAYILPQVVALLSLLAFLAIPFSLWWLMALVALVALAPLPSPGRMDAELRGYTMSMAVNLWRYGTVSQRSQDWITDQFVGPSYYFMWPFRSNMEERIEASIQDITTGAVMGWPRAMPFKAVKALIEDNLGRSAA